jgi:hypothetical protein
MYREVVLRCDALECFGKENKGKIGECSFCHMTPAILATPATSAPPAIPAPPAPSATLALPTLDTSVPVPQSPPSICFVNAAAFRMLTRINNIKSGILHIKPSNPNTALHTTTANNLTSNELNNLHSQIPTDYHNFLDIFSKSKANKLPNFNLQFDHHIDIEEGKHPPLGPIYSTSEVEAKALQDFLKENLNCGFIHQSQSSCGAPVLFTKKKDGSLHLCIDWCGLNTITKKDHYPLPLIPNLLNHLHNSSVFTKINLRGAYILVHITPGDKWKTAFQT